MTTPNPPRPGEVVGLDQSIAYASTIAAEAGEHAPAGNEAYLAHLHAAGVTGPGLSTARHMQDAFAEAQTAAERHAAELDKQRTVQAAYGQAPDTGDKTYLTGTDHTEPTGGAQRPPATGAPMSTTPTPDPAAPAAAVVKDPLKISGKLLLRDGETFGGSGSMKDRDGSLLLVAAVDTPHGRQVHVGVPIDDENRKAWRGGNAPTEETEIDEEDGEEYHVDTGAGTTVILDAADAVRMPEAVEAVVAQATEADKEYRRLIKECDRLYEERAQLEAERFDPIDAEAKSRLDASLSHHTQWQQVRRETMDKAADRLPPQDRTEYDALQEQIDAAGREVWDPDREAEAAAVCDLTVDDFREMMALRKIPWQQRTRNEQDRLDQLDRDDAPPSLLERQRALICGLTVEEFREMQALDRVPWRQSGPAEQARLAELKASPRGATAGTAKRTRQMRGTYGSYQRAHHSTKTDYVHTLAALTALEATARPLGEADTARLARVTADLDAVNQRIENLAGAVTASAAFPGRNGGALVLEAVQQDESGGVTYKVDRKPEDADDEWSPGDDGDPFSTTAGGLRKVAKLAATLAQ